MTTLITLLPLLAADPAGGAKGAPEPAAGPLTCRLELQPRITAPGEKGPPQLLPGQEFQPMVWVRNTSGREVAVPSGFDVRFRVVGPDGKALPGAAAESDPLLPGALAGFAAGSDPPPKGVRTIGPGKEGGVGYGCVSRHGFLQDAVARYDLTRPGKYSVEVAVTSAKGRDTPARVWTGTIRSAPVEVSVREVEWGPEVGGLRLGLASYPSGKGGFPVAVLLRNTGREPVSPTWDPNQMRHLGVTGPGGEKVRDDFAIVCGTAGAVTIQPGEVYCETHPLDWYILKDTKPGPYVLSLDLDVRTGYDPGAKKLALKANPLRLTRGRDE